MLWALVVSLVLNGVLVGWIAGVAMANRASGDSCSDGDVPGGGFYREEEQEYVFDPTVTARIGFKGSNGK